MSKIYRNDFSSQVCGAADKYVGTLSDAESLMIWAKLHKKEPKTMKEELSLISDKIGSIAFDAFCEGVAYAKRNSIEDVFRKEYKRPEYCNRDFCVFFNFSDNDFGKYALDAAELYARYYNTALQALIDSDGKNDDCLLVLENIETVEKIFKNGITWSYYKELLYNSELLRTNDADARTLCNILGVETTENYMIGKTNNVYQYLTGKYENIQNPKQCHSIEDIWLNGEGVIVFLKEGKMVCKII